MSYSPPPPTPSHTKSSPGNPPPHDGMTLCPLLQFLRQANRTGAKQDSEEGAEEDDEKKPAVQKDGRSEDDRLDGKIENDGDGAEL